MKLIFYFNSNSRQIWAENGGEWVADRDSERENGFTRCMCRTVNTLENQEPCTHPNSSRTSKSFYFLYSIFTYWQMTNVSVFLLCHLWDNSLRFDGDFSAALRTNELVNYGWMTQFPALYKRKACSFYHFACKKHNFDEYSSMPFLRQIIEEMKRVLLLSIFAQFCHWCVLFVRGNVFNFFHWWAGTVSQSDYLFLCIFNVIFIHLIGPVLVPFKSLLHE